jgi:hypothetical protein
MIACSPVDVSSEATALPARIALSLVALSALALGAWRFGSGEASAAVDAAFVAMTVLVLVLGIREWVRVLQRTPRFFDNHARRLTQVYNSSRGDDSDSFSR